MVRAAPVQRPYLPGVEVLEEDDAAGGQLGHQAGEHVEALGDVLQHQPLVDHVPRPGWRRLGHEVQGAHLQLRAAVGPAPAGIQVDGQDMPAVTDLVRHPASDRTATRPTSRQWAPGATPSRVR